jgi:excisionase family DNA binding protein
MPELLDIPAVRHELRAGDSTIRRWIREGRLPTVRIGRRILIRREALERFVRSASGPSDLHRMNKVANR